jgi:hypothetical protein
MVIDTFDFKYDGQALAFRIKAPGSSKDVTLEATRAGELIVDVETSGYDGYRDSTTIDITVLSELLARVGYRVEKVVADPSEVV